jgi:hypothetical protein
MHRRSSVRKVSLLRAAGLMAVGTFTVYGGVNIPIVNGSFETPQVAPGTASKGGIPGWTTEVPNFGQPPTFGVQNSPSSFFHPPSDGSQVGYMMGGTAGIHQVTGATVTVNTTYVLSTDFFTAIGPGTSATLNLYANGGQNLASKEIFQVAALANPTVQIAYTAFPNDPNIGKALAIEIVMSNGGVLFFDNVTLTAAPSVNLTVLHGAFGLIGFLPFETARVNAFCDGSVVPAPCTANLEFHDQNGGLLKVAQLNLAPGTGGSVDLVLTNRIAGGASEVVPSFELGTGSIFTSLELYDSSNMRTRLLVDWGDGAMPQTGNGSFGMAGITASDRGRASAFCPAANGSTDRPAPCDVSFEFQDVSGKVLKTSRLTVQPGTASFVDLTWQETESRERRVEVEPLWQVTSGAPVLTFGIVDNSGLTITHGFPATRAMGGR